jgi:hypothetical protein
MRADKYVAVYGPLIRDPAIHVAYCFIIKVDLIRATYDGSNGLIAPIPLRPIAFCKMALEFR